jgi:predicted nucleic acid-binding protein
MRFVDASFFVALMRSQEVRHNEARETVGARQRLSGDHRGRRKRDLDVPPATRTPRCSSARVFETGFEEHDAAWLWLKQHDEHEYSFVDSVSFEVMRRRRLSEALAFDGAFTRAGFIEVRA